MYIIIIGGGSVGEYIAKSLLDKKQNVLLIDKNKEVLEDIRERIDMNMIHGNGASVEVLEKAKIKSADILITLMENDDANILACMIAGTFTKEITTIARVRNPESAGSIDIDTYGLTQKQVGLDVIISPEKAVAEDMIKGIFFPDLTEVDYFAEEKVKLIGYTIKKDSEIDESTLDKVKLPEAVRLVGIIKRKSKFRFPKKKERLEAGDKIYMLGTIEGIRSAGKLLYDKDTTIDRVLILGGGKTGKALAEALENNKERSFTVKIIESDAKRCEELNRKLKKTLIIQGEGKENAYYNEEEIREADALVTTTGDDRINLIASIIGKEAGVKKVINALEDSEYTSVYPKMGLTTVVNSQIITARKIMRYVHKEKVVSLAELKEDVEIFEVVLEQGCRIDGQSIQQVDFPKEVLIGAIVREGTVLLPDSDTTLHGGDHLIVVAKSRVSLNLDEYFVC